MHRGEYYSGNMKYPYLNAPPDARTIANTKMFATEALRSGKPEFGIKIASPLMKLDHFDIINSFVPEYMHYFLSGVAKQYTENLLNIVSKSEYDGKPANGKVGYCTIAYRFLMKY